MGKKKGLPKNQSENLQIRRHENIPWTKENYPNEKIGCPTQRG